MDYIKGLGILVGEFNEKDILEGKDKKAVEKIRKETGYNYNNHKFIYKNNKIVGIKVYVCKVEDCKM